MFNRSDNINIIPIIIKDALLIRHCTEYISGIAKTGNTETMTVIMIVFAVYFLRLLFNKEIIKKPKVIFELY